MVLLAAILFLLSFASNRYPILRAVGYLFGAIAYICEIMVLTDCFKVKIPHNELFMPYCSARSTCYGRGLPGGLRRSADKKHRRRPVLFLCGSADLADGRLVVLTQSIFAPRRAACR